MGAAVEGAIRDAGAGEEEEELEEGVAKEDRRWDSGKDR